MTFISRMLWIYRDSSRDYESRSVHPNGPDPIPIGISTYFCSLFKMTNAQSSRIRVRNNGNKAATKKPLGNVHIRFITSVNRFQRISRIERKKGIARGGTDCNTR